MLTLIPIQKAKVQNILLSFGQALGLVTNFGKSSVHPIHCEGINLDYILEPFSGDRKSFPCKYLGLQLHTRSLQRVYMQPLIEQISKRLLAWQGCLSNKAGRFMLVTSVLFSMPTYFLTIFPLPAWARKEVDRIRWSFLWKGKEKAYGGHCLINWERVKCPKRLGGLGILDLQNMGELSGYAGCGSSGLMTLNLG